MTEQEEALPVREKETAPERGRRRRRRKKGGPALLLFLVLLLVAAGGVGAWWWYQQNQVMDTTTKYWFDKMARDGTLEGKTPEEIQGMLDAIVEEGMFNVSVNARAVFESGTSEGSLGLENIPQNRYYCRAVLRRDEDGTVLYESQGLKPGQYIDKIKLKEALPPGRHPCTVQVIATDPESLDDIGQVRVQIEVVVMN